MIETDQDILGYAAKGGYGELETVFSAHPEKRSIADEKGRTLLHLAAKNGQFITCVKLLKIKYPLALAIDKEGMTALHHAASKGHSKICKLLIDNGSDVNAKDLVGMTALMHARQIRNPEIISLLQKAGAKE